MAAQHAVAGDMVVLVVRPQGLISAIPLGLKSVLSIRENQLIAGMVLENHVNKLVLAVSPAANCATRVDMVLTLTDGVRFAVTVRSFTDVSDMEPESYMALRNPTYPLNPAWKGRLAEMREAYAKACKDDHGKPYFDTRAGDVFRRNPDAEVAPLRSLHSAVVNLNPVSPVVDLCVHYTSYAASSLSGTREFIIEGVLQYITEPPNELESEGDDEDACTEGIGLPESSSPASRVPSAQSDAASDVAEASSEIDDTLSNIDHLSIMDDDPADTLGAATSARGLLSLADLVVEGSDSESESLLLLSVDAKACCRASPIIALLDAEGPACGASLADLAFPEGQAPSNIRAQAT